MQTQSRNSEGDSFCSDDVSVGGHKVVVEGGTDPKRST